HVRLRRRVPVVRTVAEVRQLERVPRQGGRGSSARAAVGMRFARVALTFACAGLVTAVVLGGCSGGDDSSGSGASGSNVQVFHETDTSISVKRGARFVLALPANPSTGYSWKAIVSDPRVVHA